MENEEESKSLMDDLALAWEQSEGEEDVDGEQRGEVLEPAVEPEAAAEPVDATADADAVTGGIPDEEVPSEPVSDPVSEKPPVGLSLESREAWSDVPEAVKADIVKREADYEKGIVQYSQQAKRAEAMDQALAPYQQYLEMNGGAGQALNSLLQTGASLQMGSAPQKAQMVANLIKQFGVDIQTLDSMLVGEAPAPEQQQQNQFEQMLNQRLGPMQQQLQAYQQREQQATQQAQGVVAQEVNSFGANNEFYNDVRADMADLLDMAANRGREMSMDEAYKLACGNHPQITKIMQSRSQQENVAQKKQAASSISGNPGGALGRSIPNSVEAALNDAWDTVGRV